MAVSICALGGSVATPKGGLTAQSDFEVHSFDELKKLGTTGVSGKIVFYNVLLTKQKSTHSMPMAKHSISVSAELARLLNMEQLEQYFVHSPISLIITRTQVLWNIMTV